MSPSVDFFPNPILCLNALVNRYTTYTSSPGCSPYYDLLPFILAAFLVASAVLVFLSYRTPGLFFLRFIPLAVIILAILEIILFA